MANTKGGLIGFPQLASNIDVTDATISTSLGQRMYGLDRVNGTEICTYIYGQNNTGGALTQWQPVTFNPTVGSLATFIQPTTASLPNFAGVYAGQNSLPNQYYGWFLTKGVGQVTVNGTPTAIVAGDFLKCANASFLMVHDAAAGTAAAYASTVIATVGTTLASTTIPCLVLSNI